MRERLNIILEFGEGRTILEFLRIRNFDEEAQSTVEFALTMILVVALYLFLFQLTMILGFGNYVHYATFMSARAFLSAGPSQQDQTQRATQVLIPMVKQSIGTSGADKFPMIAKGVKGSNPVGADIVSVSGAEALDPDQAWQQGVRYTFQSKLFILPLAGKTEAQVPLGPDQLSPNSLTLTSESWLGRDPTTIECQNTMGNMNAIFDNGC